MNVKPITGNTNLEVLKQVAANIGGSSVEDLERECEYLKAGIAAARKKIANAVDKQRAAKWIIKRRNGHGYPPNVVRLALIAKRDAAEAEVHASYERDQFLNQYRNFRNLIYISKSVALVTTPKE